MFRAGYVDVGRFRGAPVRAHWTIPLLCLMAAGLRWAPGAWLGVLFVVAIHELGHAYLAHRQGLFVEAILLHGLGGHCVYRGQPNAYRRAVVAVGGVLAQGVLFVVAWSAEATIRANAWSVPVATWDLLEALTTTNAVIALLNALPFRPLDGAEMWKLPRLWLAHLRRRRSNIEGSSARPATPQAPLRIADTTDVDEAAVRETVRRALEQARQSASRSSSGTTRR